MTKTTAALATATHCPYCALQCAMTLTPADGNADDAAPVVGRRARLPDQPRRLVQEGLDLGGPPAGAGPSDGTARPRAWTASCTRPTGMPRSISSPAPARTALEHGADAVAVFGGGGLTNEKAYQLGKFARIALGTSRIDYNGRFCMSSAAAAGNRAFGVDRGLPFPLSDLGAASHGPPPRHERRRDDASVRRPPQPERRRREGSSSSIRAGPRPRALTDEGRGIHLQPTPGTDLALLLGLTHVVVAEGLTDAAYLADRTTGSPTCGEASPVGGPSASQSVTGRAGLR